MTRALVSSGRSDFDELGADEAGETGRARGGHGLDLGIAAFGCGGWKCGAADGDDLDAVLRLHRQQRVPGIDRAHEGVGRHDAGDIRDLRHVQQRRDARHDVLAKGVAGRQQMTVAGRELDDELRQVLGEEMLIGRVLGEEHRGDAGDLGGSLGGGAAFAPAISTWISPPIAAAAATALSVAALSVLLSCSATTRRAIRSPALRS